MNVLDLASNSVLVTIPVEGNPFGLALSSNGQRLFVATQSSTGKVVVLDTATYAQVAVITVGENPQGVAYQD